VRTLKNTLRDDFYNIYYLRQSSKAYNEEINSLKHVDSAYQQMSNDGKGYISEKEIIRVRAQLYTLQGEYNDLQNQINDAESELKLVLQVKSTAFVEPMIDSAAIAALNPNKYALSTLVDTAYQNRTDLMIAKANTNISKLNYDYQKALAVPDLSVSLNYDQQGSYVNNFTSLGVAMDLPFFNRNQGNIKNAKISIDASRASQKATEATVEENVYRALQKAFDQDRMLRNMDPHFANDFDRLMHEVLINYEKRNISLLDFLDFYDSYKQNILQLNSIQFNRISAFEDLNYYTGTNLF
jgi:cobalt-zinc-cadmium efflux system outer membrane protein